MSSHCHKWTARRAKRNPPCLMGSLTDASWHWTGAGKVTGFRGVYHRAGQRPDPLALPILRLGGAARFPWPEILDQPQQDPRAGVGIGGFDMLGRVMADAAAAAYE